MASGLVLQFVTIVSFMLILWIWIFWRPVKTKTGSKRFEVRSFRFLKLITNSKLFLLTAYLLLPVYITPDEKTS